MKWAKSKKILQIVGAKHCSSWLYNKKCTLQEMEEQTTWEEIKRDTSISELKDTCI